MMPQQTPSWIAVATSGVFVLLAVTLAYRQRIGLTREILLAALRAVLQLAAVGVVLLVLFRKAGLPGAAGWIAGMIVLAGQVAGRRGRRVPHSIPIATTAVAAGALATLGILLGTGVFPPVPQAVVPIGGMIVAGAMQASTLVLRQLDDTVDTTRPTIDAHLSLGLPATAAFAAHRRSATRTALIPVIDATKVVGLISLPGAMTGLILAGIDPLTAIRYQIIVMFMLLGAATLATTLTSSLAQRALFDHAHRLRDPPSP